MIQKINSLYAPPIFDDIEKTRIASHIFILGKIGTILFLLENVSSMVGGRFSSQFFITLFGFMIINVLPMFLTKKGFVYLAGTIYTLILWLAINYSTINRGGIHNVGFSANLVVLVAAAILIDIRATFLLAGLTSIFGLWLVTLEALGNLPPIINDNFSGFSIWITQSTFLALNAGLLYIAISRIQNALKSTRIAQKEVNKLHQDLEVAYETTLEGWAQALELRDKETVGHSRRVTKLAIKMAEKLGMNADEIKIIFYGALLHDIGKMGIPDEILNKPGPLTSDERIIIEQHPCDAYKLLKNIDYLESAIAIPYSHHENWDGSGYPQGLKGEEIPLPARIFSIADNWDALTSDRPYRKAWSQEKTTKYIRQNSGAKFDPQLVEVFFQIINN